MLRAYAGFVRFKSPAAITTTEFQVGLRSPQAPVSLSLPALADPSFFTAFECDDTAYDTIVYISNRSEESIAVTYKITNAENGAVVADSDVTIMPWRMLAFSLAGALK